MLLCGRDTICGCCVLCFSFFLFQAEDGIRDLVRSRGLGDVYKRQDADHLLDQRADPDRGAGCGIVR